MYSTSGTDIALRGGEGSAEPAVIFRREQGAPKPRGGWEACRFYCATRDVGARTLVCIMRKEMRE